MRTPGPTIPNQVCAISGWIPPWFQAKVGGVVDCVVDGENGRVVDPIEAEPIARAVLDIVNDDDSLQRMRAASRARAALFTIDRMLDRTAELYRSLHESH